MAVGLVVGAAAVTVGLLVAGRGSDGDGGGPGGPNGPQASREAAEAFLAAYERSRTGTYVAELVFTRTVPGRSGSLSYTQRLVQRPPDDRLLVGGGSAEGRRGGRVLRCATAPDGSASCTEGPPAGSYEEDVAGELGTLRDLVSGDRPVYEVAELGSDCFQLALAVAMPAPPYGERATFCFDEATGAVRRREVVRPEATDVVEATAIRREVTDADLEVGPEDLGSLPAAGSD